MDNDSRTWTQNQQDIFGDKASIYQTKASGGVWQFRCWVSEEKKYLRKSLRTKDKETAIQRAEKLYLETYGDISSSKKIFGLKLHELAEQFLAYKQNHAEGRVITAARLKVITTQVNHFLKYQGIKTKLAELNKSSAFDYADHRRKAGAKNITIRQEQKTINAMIGYAYDNGLSNLPKLEFDRIRIQDSKRRDTFTLDEYQSLYRFMRSWCADDDEKQLVRDLVLILSNTMVRIGEGLQLKWSDVINTNYRPDEKYQLVYLKVRAETSKVRKSRDVITRGGNYFDRIAKRTGKGQYVFCDPNDNTVCLPQRRLYKHWSELMNGIGIEDHKERSLTYYSLRHFGITAALDRGVSIWDVAKLAGTSASEIEAHYGHANRKAMTKAALKDRDMDILFGATGK